MWLRSTQISLQGIHAMHRWSALSSSVILKVCQVTMNPRQKPSESDSTNHPNINQLWWVLHVLSVLPGGKSKKSSRWILLKSNTWSNSANLCWLMHHVNALRSKSIPSHPYNRRHALVLASLISLWELHQWSSPLPVLPSMQSSMTCLCLETSMLMQRSHWHLMSQHFSWKLVSGISTAPTDSVPCITGLLKPRRHHDVVTYG